MQNQQVLSAKLPNAQPEFQRVCLSATVSDSKITKRMPSHVMGASNLKNIPVLNYKNIFDY